MNKSRWLALFALLLVGFALPSAATAHGPDEELANAPRMAASSTGVYSSIRKHLDVERTAGNLNAAMPTAPTAGSIYGKVTYQGSNAGGIFLELRFWNGGTYSTRQQTYTNPDGTYTFTGIPALGANQIYYVRFMSPPNSSYLAGWWSYDIETFTGAEDVPGGSFDIANVFLQSPLPGFRGPFPITFQWQVRSATPADNYTVEAFNPSNWNPYWESPLLGYVNSTSLNSLPPGFAFGTVYGWDVRVIAPDGGFGLSYYYRTITFLRPPLPATFSKSSPPNAATAQPLTLTLNWGSSTGADSYEYCIYESGTNRCSNQANWVNVGTDLTTTIGPLKAGVLHYWQVRARNTGGIRLANGGTWWSFKTLPYPGAFNKTSPLNGATAQSIATQLKWLASSGATEYEYCIDKTNDNACDGAWISTGTARVVSPATLDRGATYYWQVRAKNLLGSKDANAGIWWSFTIVQNLLKNGDFELDANADNRPDIWTSSPKFTRTSDLVKLGTFAGQLKATDNSGATILQTVTGIKAGKKYYFTGWVNIPATADTFTFRVQIKWKNATGGVLSTTTLKSYTTSTVDWDQVAASVVAPAGATSAQVVMSAGNLNATVYVDDFELWW